MKKILIVELTLGGHRLTTLKYLINYAVEHGFDIEVLTLRSTIEESDFPELGVPTKAIEGFDVEQSHSKSVIDMFLQQCKTYRIVAKYLKEYSGSYDACILPTAQQIGLMPLGLSFRGFPMPWVGVVMAPAAHLDSYGVHTHHSKFEKIVQKIAYRNIFRQKNCLRIASFDPFFSRWAKDKKVTYCVDPVELHANFEHIDESIKVLNNISKTVLLVVGTLDKRKSLPLIADVLTNGSAHSDFHVIAAGAEHRSTREILRYPAVERLTELGRITVISRRITDTELDYLYSISDIVWSGNLRTYGSSGTIVRAGMHRKPVIVNRKSIMGNWIQEAGGGPVIDMADKNAISNELVRLKSDCYRVGLAKANYKLFESNTSFNYADCVFTPFR